MSNLFNSPVNKAKISSILGRDLAPGQKEIENTFPQNMRPDETTAMKSKDVYMLALETKAILRAPQAIRSLVIEPTVKYLEPDLVERWLSPTVNMPNGPTEFLPKYRQTPFISNYDLAFYKQLLYVYLQPDIMTTTDSTDNFTAFDKIVRETVFGSGSTLGQFTRLRSMYDIRYGLNGKHNPVTLPRLGYDQESFAVLLERTLPIAQPRIGMMPLLTRMSGFLDPEDDISSYRGDFIPSINLKAASGLPYIGKSKGVTFTEAIVLADQFLTRLSKNLANPKELKQLLADYWYFGTSLLVAKAERYDRTKWTTNTRNIMAASFPAHLMGNMISAPVMDNSRFNAVTHDTESLQKFNPFKGGLQEILNKATRPGHQYFIYADNIYLSYEEEPGRHTWFSLDLEKGEANATPSIASYLGYYLLTRGWIDDDGQPCFNATWAAIATTMMPTWFVDSTALIANLQIKIPGQTSGNPWTFHINHCVSSVFIDFMEREGNPRPGSKGWFTVISKTGIDMKIEKELLDLEKVMQSVIDQTPKEGFMQGGPIDPGVYHYLPSIELDLLGWDAVYSNRLNKFIPSLGTDRFYKSAAYPKKMEAREFKGQQLAFAAYEIIRYEALLYVGGCYRGCFAVALENMGKARRKTQEGKFGMEMSKILKDWALLTELGEPEWLRDVNMNIPFNEQAMIDLNNGVQVKSMELPVRYNFKKRLEKATSLGETKLIEVPVAPAMVASWMNNELEAALRAFKSAHETVDIVEQLSWSEIKERMEGVKINWAEEMEKLTRPETSSGDLKDVKLKNLRQLQDIRETLSWPLEVMGTKTLKYSKDLTNYNNYVAKYRLYRGDTKRYDAPLGSLAIATGQPGHSGVREVYLESQGISRTARKNRARRAKAKETAAYTTLTVGPRYQAPSDISDSD